MDNSPTFLFWSPERDNAQTYSQVCRLTAHRQYPLKMMTTNNDLKQPSDFPNAEEEQHCDPNLHHGRPAAINTLTPIPNNPPLSHMGCGPIGAVPEFECLSLPLGRSPNRPLYDVHEFLLIMKSLDAVLELPFPASDQVRLHTSYQPARPIKAV